MIGKCSAHLNYMFTELPLLERFAAAAEAGFSAVEHRGPYEIAAPDLRALLKQNGLTFVQLALPFGDPARGERGFACLRDRQRDFDASLDKGLDYADAIGCNMVHMMSGVVPAGVSRRDLWPVYLDRLRQAAEAAARRGMTLLIEPIGVATIPDYFLADPYDGLRALDMVGLRNIRLLLDAFHATNAGVDAARFLARHADVIAHVHIADYPGRHEPGTGAFSFGRLFSAIDGVGYRGRIGLKYIPAVDTQSGLEWLELYPSIYPSAA
jgi:hydroxypyruvate isomerase